MLILIFSFAACIAILFIIFFFAWRYTDWKKIDEANKEFYNEDGDHVYYDRRVIEQKKKENLDKIK